MMIIKLRAYLDVNPLLFEKGFEFVHEDALRHGDDPGTFKTMHQDRSRGRLCGGNLSYIGKKRRGSGCLSKLKPKRH